MLRTITYILQTCNHRDAKMYIRALIAKMKYKMQIANTYHAKLHRVTNTGSFSINWAFAIPMKKTPQPDDEGNQVNKIKKSIILGPGNILQELPASPLTATLSAKATGEAGPPLHPHSFRRSPWPWSR